jgi:uncharacterized protein
MVARTFDPRRLDVAAFAKAGGELAGTWPVSAMPRLADSAVATDVLGDVAWSARGERRAGPAGDTQTWLHLTATTRLPLACQRCLEPVEVALDIRRSLLFVAGEELAAELDAESEDDVLALTRALDLQVLLEDELLLELPLVPRHETCPMPLTAPNVAATEPAKREHPFAALAAWRGGKAT